MSVAGYSEDRPLPIKRYGFKQNAMTSHAKSISASDLLRFLETVPGLEHYSVAFDEVDEQMTSSRSKAFKILRVSYDDLSDNEADNVILIHGIDPSREALYEKAFWLQIFHFFGSGNFSCSWSENGSGTLRVHNILQQIDLLELSDEFHSRLWTAEGVFIPGGSVESRRLMVAPYCIYCDGAVESQSPEAKEMKVHHDECVSRYESGKIEREPVLHLWPNTRSGFQNEAN
ncbi:MAG: hypothetical protein EOP06_10505 [Proteobacteria bacterium]|nr:MAG: hypothetical protein EOP06_10505 [Pseudomonadota bacterium]